MLIILALSVISLSASISGDHSCLMYLHNTNFGKYRILFQETHWPLVSGNQKWKVLKVFLKREETFMQTNQENLVSRALALFCVICTVGEPSTPTYMPQFVTKIERMLPVLETHEKIPIRLLAKFQFS